MGPMPQGVDAGRADFTQDVDVPLAVLGHAHRHLRVDEVAIGKPPRQFFFELPRGETRCPHLAKERIRKGTVRSDGHLLRQIGMVKDHNTNDVFWTQRVSRRGQLGPLPH